MLEAEKMGTHKDLSVFDNGQIVMARQLGQSISKTANIVGVPSLQWSVPIKSGPRKNKC